MEKRLVDFDENKVFYRGTIIVLKSLHKSPVGDFDAKYAMIGGVGGKFAMLDLYRGIGGCIMHDLAPNVEMHFGVNKAGIFAWVKEHLEMFYTVEGQDKFLSDADNRIFIDDLENHFIQANRDLFMGKSQREKSIEKWKERGLLEGIDTAEDLKKSEEPEPTKLRIEDDPNYEKYCQEIEQDSEIKRTDQFFESLFFLHKHLQETPEDELQKEWKSIEDMGLGGPTVEEYFQGINPQYQYAKGYTESAAKFKEDIIIAVKALDQDASYKQQMIDVVNEIYNTK